MDIKTLALEAKLTVLTSIESEWGISDDITLSVRKFKNPTWVAMYRGEESFSKGHPVIWINANFEAICSEYNLCTKREVKEQLMLSIAHEYGHAIYRLNDDPRIAQLIDEAWGDEEGWAEDFGKEVLGEWHHGDPAKIDEVMALYSQQFED